VGTFRIRDFYHETFSEPAGEIVLAIGLEPA